MKIKMLIASLVAVFGFTMLYVPAPVLAQADEVLRGVQITGAPPATEAEAGITGVIQNVINILSVVVGVASVIMIIVGGFQYVISSGDGSKVGNAKNTILYAVIGLVIVAFAQVIVNFVLTEATQPVTTQSEEAEDEASTE